MHINPYLTNEFSHHYQLDEPTFLFRGVRIFIISFFDASHLGLCFCLCPTKRVPDLYELKS